MCHQERRWLWGAHGLPCQGMGVRGVLGWLLTPWRAQVLGLALGEHLGGYFAFFLIFLQHLKTSPVIYILPDTCINTINKSSLMPLCSDKCNRSSSCYHIHRNLASQRSLLLMLCRWEQKSFAVFFESQYHRTVLALQIPNLGDPCEQCPSCCHLSLSCNGTFSCLWECRIRRTFQWAVGFWSLLGFSGQANCFRFYMENLWVYVLVAEKANQQLI